MTCSTLSRQLVLWVTLATCQLAWGDSNEAKALVGEGNRHYQLGHFVEASLAYEKAYELSSAPGILYNLAQCHRMVGDFERAAFYYQRYLSSAPAPIPNEAMARQLLAECRQKVAQRAKSEDATRKAEEEVNRAVEARLRADLEVARFEEARKGAAALEVARPDNSLLRKWWFWTAVGVIAVGAGSAAAVAGNQPRPPPASLGDISF